MDRIKPVCNNKEKLLKIIKGKYQQFSEIYSEIFIKYFLQKSGTKNSILMRLYLLISIFCIFFHSLLAQEKGEKESTIPKKFFTTQAVVNEAPVIDGLLNDEAWTSLEWGSDFTQIEPNKGVSPSQKTAFKILYDAKNMYVAIKAIPSRHPFYNFLRFRIISFDCYIHVFCII